MKTFLLALLLIGCVFASSSSESDSVSDNSEVSDVEQDSSPDLDEGEDDSDSDEYDDINDFEDDEDEEEFIPQEQHDDIDYSQSDEAILEDVDQLKKSGVIKVTAVIIRCSKIRWVEGLPKKQLYDQKINKSYVDARLLRVDKRLRQSSYGKSSLTQNGNRKWKIIDKTLDNCPTDETWCKETQGANNCNWNRWKVNAKAIAAGTGYDLLMFFPPIPKQPSLCVGSGICSTCKDPICRSMSLIGKSILMISPYDAQWKQKRHCSQTIIHEMGHSFGFLHSGKKGYRSEYGDPISIMGKEDGSFSREYDVIRRFEAGWLSNDCKKTFDRSDLGAEAKKFKMMEINQKPLRGYIGDHFWMVKIKDGSQYWILEYRGWNLDPSMKAKYRNSVVVRRKKTSGGFFYHETNNCGSDVQYIGYIKEGKDMDVTLKDGSKMNIKYDKRPGNGGVVHMELTKA